MATSRHLFASLKYRAVTQIRVSNDGMPDDTEWRQWQIGESAVLAFALGIIPFKDNFWTTAEQCDNPYYAGHCTEPNTVLESAVATFSAGAVAPGDGVGQSNVSLIFRSINAEGRLLKPSRPMGSLDQWYAANAFTPGGIGYQLQSTYTELQGLRWHYTLAVNHSADLVVTRAALHLDLDPVGGRYWEYRSVMGVDDWGTLTPFKDDHTIPASRLPSFTITHLVPVLDPSPLLLIGEKDRWVKVSANRIVALDVTDTAVTAALTGEGRESVAMMFAVAGASPKVVTATCALGMDGTGSMTIRVDGTWACAATVREGEVDRTAERMQETAAMTE